MHAAHGIWAACIFFVLLTLCFIWKFSIYKVIIWNAFWKFSGWIKYILKKIKAFLCEYGIVFPCILFFVTVNNFGYVFDIRFRELRSDYFGNLFRTVWINVINSLLDSICKGLNCFRVFLDVAFVGAICRIWYITAFNAKRTYNVSVTLVFKKRRVRFKFNGVIFLLHPLL